MQVKIRKPYERLAKAEKPVIDMKGKTLTEQAHKQETDINYILRNYQKTGIIRHVKKHEGTYDDVLVQDFTDAMELVTNVVQRFNELPSSVRNRVDNSPAKFLHFVQNPANKEELRQFGLLAGNDGLTGSGAPSGAPTPDIAAEPPAAQNPST